MRGRCRRDGDDVDLVPDTLSRQLGKPLAPVADVVLDRDGLSVHIPQLAQALEESGKPWRRRLRCARVERDEAQSRELPRLRLCREPRSKDAPTDRGDECSSVHQSWLIVLFRRPGATVLVGSWGRALPLLCGW